jgi:hypothetical protein
MKGSMVIRPLYDMLLKTVLCLGALGFAEENG